MKRLIVVAGLMTGLLVSSWAMAEPRVYLNNVDITYVRSQFFEDVNVSIDSEGNINIIGERYKISRKTDEGTVAEGSTYQTPDEVKQLEAAMRQKQNTLPDNNAPVYLVALFNQPGLLGHAVSVYINDKLVKTLSQNEAQQVFDVSSYLVKGVNRIQYKVVKAASAGSSSRATVTISYAKVSSETATDLELSGNYGELVIRSLDGEKDYSLELIKP